MLGGLLGSAAPATAYVRSVTAQGCHAVFWAQTCVYMTPDANGLPEMPISDVNRIGQEAMESWQTRTNPSSFLQLKFLPATIPRETDPTDGLTEIVFRSQTWCRPAETAGGQPTCYDPSAAALTTVTYINEPTDATQDGRIVDADIELNDVNNYFYDADTNPNPQPPAGRNPTDLWNTLTHEMGHVQGLDHTCRRGAFDVMPMCTVDDTGQPVIECTTVQAGMATDPTLETIYNTTMYPTASPEETKKRIPKADDLSAIINTYPLSADPRVCVEPSAATGASGGCSAAVRTTTAGAPWLFLASGFLGLLGLLHLRRSRRRNDQAA
jgi:hypothetical protein